MIRVTELHKSYGRIHAVRGVDFQVAKGETLGIIGPNGAGKSTILKILLGLVRPDRGTITVAGHDLARDPVESRRPMGYVPQKDGFEDGATGTEALCFLARLRGADPGDVGRYAEMVGVGSLLDRQVGTLSGGQRQRLSLAASLLGDPPVLLLDEPTASLDPRATAGFRALVERLSTAGRTIILCSHLLADVDRLCHRVLILLEGRIAAIEENRGLPTSLIVELEDPVGAETVPDGFGNRVRRFGERTLETDLDASGQIRLLSALVESGARVRSFETRRPSLEERFLSRVGKTEGAGST